MTKTYRALIVVEFLIEDVSKNEGDYSEYTKFFLDEVETVLFGRYSSGIESSDSYVQMVVNSIQIILEIIKEGKDKELFEKLLIKLEKVLNE